MSRHAITPFGELCFTPNLLTARQPKQSIRTALAEAPQDVESEPISAALAASASPMKIVRLVGGIIGAMAIGAMAVSTAVLSGAQVLLGSFVALTLMAFIGLPLILASVADAAEAH